MGQFIVTYQNDATTREPSQSALYHPAAGRMLLFSLLIEFLLADAPNVRHITKRSDSGFARRVIVTFVQTQVLRLLLGRFGPLHDDSIQCEG